MAEAYALGPYADWAIEGLGHDYAAWRLTGGATRGILTDGAAASLPAGTLTMMHAGLGLALAERTLPRLTPWCTHRQFEGYLADYAGWCVAHGQAGFRGAAWESLGLVARTWHPGLVPGLAAACEGRDDGVAGFFWHGAGRALYFLPAYIVPVLSPWRGADREAPHDLARRNLHAGLAWAWTLVNIRHAAILAGLVDVVDSQLKAEAIANGITSALVVAIDTTPNDPYVLDLSSRGPAGSARASAAWNALVRPAVAMALNRLHPLLRDRGALDAVFRYAELNSLAGRLERAGDRSADPPGAPRPGSDRPGQPPRAGNAS